VVVTAIATSVAAYYTTKQWETAQDQERRSLRAYLGIANYKVDRAEGAITFDIANGGQTPARNVRVVRNLKIDPAWKEYAKNLDFADLPESAGASRGSALVILPQKSFPFSLPVEFDQFDQAKQGKWTVFLWGRLTPSQGEIAHGSILDLNLDQAGVGRDAAPKHPF
jgi:hypothetical protein